ncbi:MAG: aldo/keto reductase [Pseudomonadota bacterium]|nr:aldo/keto reductase [Pseudomonadota bacterium]
MTATLLLQARTNSSRLPGKVLLPVAGVPLVVLAALRAGNTGHRVVVVTSGEKSDDALCDVLKQWKVDYFRGDLNNTLKRFVDAIDGLPDERLVVRLTGDNILPDGSLIDELLNDFTQRDLAYLSCGGAASGLPYGVSAEVTRAGYLRDAYQEANTAFEREHVTPRVIARFGRTVFERYRLLSMSLYRCTVDTLDDYLRVCRLFKNVGKPENVSLDWLLERLKQISPEVITSNSACPMVLGTAQLGLAYGITNTSGRPNQSQVNVLVQAAIANGVQYLDTARAYGDSEQVLGEALSGGWDSRVSVITKLSPLDDCSGDVSSSVIRACIEQSIYKSCHSLRVQSLDVLMLHRAEHLTAWQGAAWSDLIELKEQGVIKRLGVSVQSPEEALFALDFNDVEFIQLPFNILDYRWHRVIEKVSQVKNTRPLVIHARSALLQGLLTSGKEDLWRRARCSNAVEVIGWLQAKADEYTGGDIVELSLRYVCSQKWIDGVVVGVETIEQLNNNLVKLNSACWSDEQVELITADRPLVPVETLNPAKWKA